mmetsp:Transcript_24447/g.67563  ORF Transcript_24447/g.67563 Transcript_24447/m.67563 type:complete len:1179 (+) Transcript_24447:381-3917(+)|eukprot:CAMPEP_0172363386 /NCGR_PEP_ID=MMETSP1060-20121228/6762_1 /TAXON_ID=37318 /ORGANISM="Pseudo-nitzschia pungens, Strain cf. cingulata" /LENGTH=1178 /DNA_ID=CAMNT_0013086115 /DNA_START=285 /DNA_END=3821 /DNA_ORIENTATION=+
MDNSTAGAVTDSVSSGVTNVDGFVTLLFAGTVFLFCYMVIFGLIIHFDLVDDIAPRVANRPRSVLKNAILGGIDKSNPHRNHFYFYPLAWIHWAYQLTYKECMFGIPNTGTHEDGKKGPLLKTNLDAVVLLRFHALLFKIALLMALLCLFIIIPVNVTATCDDDVFGILSCKMHRQEKTFFHVTTLAHVPDNRYDNVTDLDPASILAALKNITSTNGDNWWVEDQTWRVFATVICCLAMYIYTMYLLNKEWVEQIYLRRNFFLEGNHRRQRLRELNKIEVELISKSCKQVSSHRKEDGEDNEKKHGEKEAAVKSSSASDGENSDTSTEGKTERILPPFLTHPSIRETPPSVGLYSALYRLPNSMITYGTDGATQVERQLVATTEFFEDVVPAMPGFDSSVAAVTVIPNGKLVAKVWNCWTACAKKLHTLRLIRKFIAAKESESASPTKQKNLLPPQQMSRNETDDGQEANKEQNQPIDHANLEMLEAGCNVEVLTPDDPIASDAHSPKHNAPAQRASSNAPAERKFTYAKFDIVKYARSMGFGEEVDNMTEFVDGMGIEEFNVFAYNSAMLAGVPDIAQTLFKNYNGNIEYLKEEEADIIEELAELQSKLFAARSAVMQEQLDEPVVPGDDEYTQIQAHQSQDEGEKSGRVFNEWGITEREMEMMFPPVPDSLSLSRMMKRIMFGTENSHYNPDVFGVKDGKGKAYKTDIRCPSYAVVTFTSRNAAVIARQCLADGKIDSWKQVDDIPVYPLADAPPFSWSPRGFMRPVTPAIPFSQKKIRLWITYIFLVLFTTFYIGIIEFVNSYIWKPTKYLEVLKGEFAESLSSSLSGLTQVLLFSICPVIFRMVANFEGSSTSMQKAEERALLFFWYFYVVARFMGQIVYSSVTGFLDGTESSMENVVTGGISKLAQTVPSQLGPAALSFIMFSAFISWPAMYFLQVNHFLTSMFRLGWINRLLKGGGPGAEIPYRIYVDSGYVLACVTSLAPLCPLIGPVALIYFIILAPMLRWLIFFGYRPRFDGGGDKWPELYHIVVTSLLLGQLVTGASIILKGNIIEGVIIVCCIIPTLLYNSVTLDKYFRQFSDTSLLQTDKIDDANKESYDSMQEREEFRRFLVDCHKASYVPTCLAGGKDSLITAEPAQVIPVDGEGNYSFSSRRELFERQVGQKGGSLRRHRFNL